MLRPPQPGRWGEPVIPEADLLAGRFQAVWASLEPIGRRGDGGYDRFAWSAADLELRAWFRQQASERDMPVEQDRNGNLWAWWGEARAGSVATGSHLDSVPAGGAFDGPLGVVAGLLAVDELRRRSGGTPARSIAVVDFAEEEGGRFGVACLGSRLSSGTVDAARARGLTDSAGVTLAEAMRAGGADPDALGPDDERIGLLAAFVELHVEQGRCLADHDAPIGIASGIWPHGRWHLRFEGEANHAGTTRLEDRRDPVLPFAAAVGAARSAAERHGGLATIGRAQVVPNATNGVPSSVDAWLDARAPDDAALRGIVADVGAHTAAVAADHGVGLEIRQESTTPAVAFDAALRHRMAGVLGDVPEIPTGAGHDAGVLAARTPAGMLFVRNRSGISHSPAERADVADCVVGVRALADVLWDLAWR
jgi:beta-ureidopropionase / N-carbamoyl-L-amino-acid hydrolase